MAIEKREQIIEIAMNLFAEKGYFLTSIQEIAEKSGVAKGSVYKYFASKEDLLIAVFEFYHKKVMEKADEIKLTSNNLSSREIFREQIKFLLDSFIKNKQFIKLQYREQTYHEDNKIKPYMLCTRKKMMSWYKEGIIYAYGDSIIPYAFDVVIILQGMIRGYQSLLVADGKEIDVELTAKFIMDRMEVIVEDLITKKPTPVLNDFYIGKNNKYNNNEDNINSIIEEIKKVISLRNLVEIEKMIVLLEQEINKADKNRPIINAYLDYLEKLAGLRELVGKLKRLLI